MQEKAGHLCLYETRWGTIPPKSFQIPDNIIEVGQSGTRLPPHKSCMRFSRTRPFSAARFIQAIGMLLHSLIPQSDVCICFRATQYCHPLPHVIGLTVSEYYEMIWLPSIMAHRSLFLRLKWPATYLEAEGHPKFLVLLSLHAELLNPDSPSANLTVYDSFV